MSLAFPISSTTTRVRGGAAAPILVNVGCGAHYHAAWRNIDLVASGPCVIEHDLRRGLPFADASCDAVYHSHVLEHLSQGGARKLLSECRRILKPGGILRVVVPDLEGIVRQYLSALEESERDDTAYPRLEWMTIELIDQMVRTRPGGEMIRCLRDESPSRQAFVRSRVGWTLGAKQTAVPSWRWRAASHVKLAWRKFRDGLASAAVLLLAGHGGYEAFRRALLIRSAEVHRWMYDRVSLRRLLEQVGFQHVEACSAFESRIPNFCEYELDVIKGEIRKPDSLFMEAA